MTLVARSHTEVSRFFRELHLVDPGVVSVSKWHPELALDEDEIGDVPVPLFGAVGFKSPLFLRHSATPVMFFAVLQEGRWPPGPA